MTTVTARGIWADDVDPSVLDARRVDGFTGAIGQTRIEQHDTIVVLTGLGDRAAASAASAWRAAAAAARRVAAAFPLSMTAADPIAIQVDLAAFSDVLDDDDAAAAAAAGIIDGGYRFRMTDASTFHSRSLPAEPVAAVPPAGWQRGTELAAAVNYARDLVNLPASALTPIAFAQHARELLEPLSVHVTVREAAELADTGYGGVIAIGKGSVHPPVLLELSVGKGTPEYSFVGKGVTYDSGGLSLKPADALMDMKSDMAGAAAVVAAFSLLPALAPNRRFVGVLPLVENMPGPAATRPGDVVRLRNDSTIEILNTDFEGRVILADALCRAVEHRPHAIVDLASLTYAARHALGDGYGALVATDEMLASRVLAAGDRSGDRVWRLPLQPDLSQHISSSIADYKNFPDSPHARVSTAALLLSRFVGDIPWAHVDMAGLCFRQTDDPWGISGGTGYGVRLILEIVRRT